MKFEFLRLVEQYSNTKHALIFSAHGVSSGFGLWGRFSFQIDGAAPQSLFGRSYPY